MNALHIRFEEALLAGDEAEALRLIDQALEENLTPVDVMQRVIAPALVAVGNLWAEGRLNVAQEHLASRLALRSLEQLRSRSRRRETLGARAIVACLPGEQHEIGARMLADLLFLDGWDVDFLGANVPAEDLVLFVRSRQARLLALSLSNVDSEPLLEALLEKVKELPQPPLLALGGAASMGKRWPVQVQSNDLRYAVHRLRELLEQELEAVEKQSEQDFYQNMGRRLSMLRKERGFSQAELAQAADLDRTYLSGVERGKQNPSVGVLLRLSSALGVSLQHILLPD
ncbi:MAG: B12-binding domain-containing protein [Myxococcota bacterium]|jgi:methanogenic corrinoid protein MtbC1/DNA-binding XRE family transcriptional regulator|nr:B12-binding domain-containing protein [Myxococcota bacterium]